ncbi:MAG: hypothetical protein F4047_07190 [Caldilineaceae bacterium SB0670_bin_27]|uniref:Uncharacterized protein n=1 Tax=Caldilineaceae bacterium SB0664_bin_27 TaxID=2605260 RepID=A0A6B0YYR5_9CHLR|nr:hypothetical protein [Caldilineaceae bacterium SB0664_bin_27]MYJ77923.1 hypothetical protein [Caldilineaceae bacterium SB0670_bin_27]
MARIDEKEEFSSWLVALKSGLLTESQKETLQQLVDDGKAATLEEAARYLDWQDSVIDPTEHFYGH